MTTGFGLEQAAATPARAARKLTIAKAMAEAVSQEMRRDPNVFVMGEDIGALGGVWGNMRGLLQEFGPARVRDTPISESAFIGAAVGAAMTGMRPLVELMFVDFIGVCLDPLFNMAAKNSYHTAGRWKTPMVLTTAVGGGYCDSTQHSQCLYATFAHLPGLKVVVPSTAYDAKGMLIAALRDDNPVVFMHHKALQGMGFLGTVKGAITDVPLDSYTVPLDRACVVRPGRDISIFGVGATVHLALEAAEQLAGQGWDAEVVDLRSLAPLDRNTIVTSARKTGRALVVDEDYMSYGLTAEILAIVSEQAFTHLKCAPRRIAYPDIPPPFARPMEEFAMPNVAAIVATALDMKREGRG